MTLQFGCCFCGKADADRGLAVVDMDGDFEQQWWCHLACLVERMVPEAAAAATEEDA